MANKDAIEKVEQAFNAIFGDAHNIKSLLQMIRNQADGLQCRDKAQLLEFEGQLIAVHVSVKALLDRIIDLSDDPLIGNELRK